MEHSIAGGQRSLLAYYCLCLLPCKKYLAAARQHSSSLIHYEWDGRKRVNPSLLKNFNLAVKLSILVFLALTVMLVGVVSLLVLNTRILTEEIGGERVNEEVN